MTFRMTWWVAQYSHVTCLVTHVSTLLRLILWNYMSLFLGSRNLWTARLDCYFAPFRPTELRPAAAFKEEAGHIKAPETSWNCAHIASRITCIILYVENLGWSSGGEFLATRGSALFLRNGRKFSIDMVDRPLEAVPPKTFELKHASTRSIHHLWASSAALSHIERRTMFEVWSLGGSCEGSTRSAFSKLVWAITSQAWVVSWSTTNNAPRTAVYETCPVVRLYHLHVWLPGPGSSWWSDIFCMSMVREAIIAIYCNLHVQSKPPNYHDDIAIVII